MKKPLPSPPVFALIALLLIGIGIGAGAAIAREGDADKLRPIRIKGSDTLTKALKEWIAAYQKLRPEQPIEMTGGGSGNGIAALINGHVEVASSSRILRPSETHLVSKKNAGTLPVAHEVALDAVSIVVHKNNPLNGLSLGQLMEIYGRTAQERQWQNLGVQVPGCPDQKILALSRKNNSGTYAFFRQSILNKNDHFDPRMVSMDASDSLVSMVSQAPCAIGYAGMAFITGEVKTLCISQGQGPKAPCVPPTPASTLDKSYPLSRSLYLYTLGEPVGELKLFLEWVKGADGREILRRSGYVPPP